MALIINTNISALTAQRNLTRAQSGLERSIQRLSTGLRINNAADDAAGLAISDRLTAQIRGLNQAVRNANDGVSALQTADGSLNEVSNLLQRGRELAIQSANDSNSSSDRQSLNAELSNILAELDRLASTVQFNSRKLLDGTFTNAQFQIGANAFETVTFSIASVNTTDLGAKVLVGNAMSSTGFTDLAAGQSITVNGVAVAIGAQTTIEGVIDAINNKSGDTGATAAKNAQTIVTDTGFVALTTAGGVADIDVERRGDRLEHRKCRRRVHLRYDRERLHQPDRRCGRHELRGRHVHPFQRRLDFASETTASVGVGDTVASTAARTFNAGFTLSVDLSRTLTVVSSTVGDRYRASPPPLPARRLAQRSSTQLASRTSRAPTMRSRPSISLSPR